MRILITGARGQLGSELVRCLATMRADIGPIPDEYTGAEVDAVGHGELDIASQATVEAWFASHSYDIVFNCAAFNDVDGCENDEAVAYGVNASGVGHLAQACATQGAKLVHVSTDYVFAGDEPTDRTEDDPTAPINAYGRTKLAGERIALAENPRTFVCRTAWLFGRDGRNFVKTMLRLGALHEAVTVVDDQWGNPTSANDLAYELLKVALTEEYGIYHMTGKGTVSRAKYAAAIMRQAGLACRIISVSNVDYRAAHPQSAPRPRYSGLENRRLAQTIGDEMRPWQEALAAYLECLSKGEGGN